MNFLIVGLGNIGPEYKNTRHNIGFEIVDQLAKSMDAEFESARYATYAKAKFRGKSVHLIKPTTYMNLSGKAVRHWMSVLKINIEQVLIITDDLNLPLNKLRLRAKGSPGGHNGLKSITELLGHPNYPRLRVGVGSDFAKGRQVDFVLGKWTSSEEVDVQLSKDQACEAIKSFVVRGIAPAMTEFNK
jgi:peptidyl-tRNA hydrolase, PTH1 family